MENFPGLLGVFPDLVAARPEKRRHNRAMQSLGHPLIVRMQL